MIHDQITADDRIADALWFFKGLAAGARDDETSAQASALAEGLAQVRHWLARVADGEHRLLGVHECNFRVVLAEHEFEKLVDAARDPSPGDPQIVRPIIARICEQITLERRQFADRRNPEVPF